MVNLDNTENPSANNGANRNCPYALQFPANQDQLQDNKSDSEEGDSEVEVNPRELLFWYQRVTQARKRKEEEMQGEIEYKKRKLEAYEKRNRIMEELTQQRKKLNEVLEKYVTFLTGRAKTETSNVDNVDPEAIDKLTIAKTDATKEVDNNCDSNNDDNNLNISASTSTDIKASTSTDGAVGNIACANTE